jgi:hypothetical protein
VAEFLEEYRHEPEPVRARLLAQEPQPTGDQRWDVFLAALAEHLAARDGRGSRRGRRNGGCARSGSRSTPGPPAPTPSCTHRPRSGAAGIFVAPQELEVA